MFKKKGYTAAQRKAYNSGMGYRAGKEGRAINFKNPKNKESFSAGYKAAGNIMAKNSSKYPKISK